MAKVSEIAKTPLSEQKRKLRVAAYCRVSNPTDEQYDSVEAQEGDATSVRSKKLNAYNDLIRVNRAGL